VKVSIVVPTYGRAEALERCLDSIERTVELEHEVVCVVVQGDEATEAVVAERTGKVRCELQGERTGFVRAANLGFRAARGEYVVQLNDDCELLPWTISNAVRFMEAPAHRDVVGMAAFYHDTPVRRNVNTQIDVEGIRYVTCHVRGLCYANFGMVRRELGEQLGWYDERFRFYGADPDFSLKVWHEAGLEVRPCAGALVRHLMMEDERGREDRARQGDDNAKLFAKWGM